MVRPAVAAVVTGLDEGHSLGPLGPAAVAAGTARVTVGYGEACPEYPAGHRKVAFDLR